MYWTNVIFNNNWKLQLEFCSDFYEYKERTYWYVSVHESAWKHLTTPFHVKFSSQIFFTIENIFREKWTVKHHLDDDHMIIKLRQKTTQLHQNKVS